MKDMPSIKSLTEMIYSFSVTYFIIFISTICTTPINPFSPIINKFYESIFFMNFIPDIITLFLGPTLTYFWFFISIYAISPFLLAV